MIPDDVRPLISRFVAALLPAVLVRLGRLVGIPVSDDFIHASTDIAAFMLVYMVTHRLIDRKANPGDAASPTLAAADKAQNKQLAG